MTVHADNFADSSDFVNTGHTQAVTYHTSFNQYTDSLSPSIWWLIFLCQSCGCVAKSKQHAVQAHASLTVAAYAFDTLPSLLAQATAGTWRHCIASFASSYAVCLWQARLKHQNIVLGCDPVSEGALTIIHKLRGDALLLPVKKLGVQCLEQPRELVVFALLCKLLLFMVRQCLCRLDA